MRRRLFILGWALGCGSQAGAPVPPAMEQARLHFPTVFEVHTEVAAATCSPNPGVCHSSAEYPDLQTVSRLLDQVGAPCNVRHPVPEEGWDPCEGLGDYLVLGDSRAEIGWLERLGAGIWRAVLRQPVTLAPSAPLKILDPAEEVLFELPESWSVTVEAASDGADLSLTFALDPSDLAIADALLESVRGGDPNRNGVFGASDPALEPAALIWPDDRDRSYLWRRLLGDVPGSRMPLANGPLSEAQFFALGCWIESLTPGAAPELDAPIDYAACTLADVPHFE